ncbi:group II intron maturase-specific domain-containing protein [Nonomuraea sp. NPDC002799]
MTGATGGLRGWCAYFRHGVSKATVHYLDVYAWRRVAARLRKRHLAITWKKLHRRFPTGRPGNHQRRTRSSSSTPCRSRSLVTGGARTTSRHHQRASWR